jgi:hypothetical protein
MEIRRSPQGLASVDDLLAGLIYVLIKAHVSDITLVLRLVSNFTL